jgi:hypothetical protein
MEPDYYGHPSLRHPRAELQQGFEQVVPVGEALAS